MSDFAVVNTVMSSPVDEKQPSVDDHDTNVIQAHTEDVYEDSSLDPVYQAKARLLNNALQEIGMGKYQVGLSVMAYVFA